MPVEHLEQRLGIVQPDAVHPAAADRNRVMVQADQMMAIRRLAQRPLEKGQLLLGQAAEHCARHQGIEQHDPPGANFGDRLQQAFRIGHRAHGGQFVVVARAPANRRTKTRRLLAKALIGGNRTILRKIAGRQRQIDHRLFGQHQIDDLAQAVMGIEP